MKLVYNVDLSGEGVSSCDWEMRQMYERNGDTVSEVVS
jgi:hypothetical protein